MDPVSMNSRLVNRNIVAATGRSSMRLEPEIWDALFEICRRENIAMADLVRKVDGGREVGGRTSAIRVFAFNYFRQAATEDGHRCAGHGGVTEPEKQDAPATDEARVPQFGPV
jgi:predicted DNA-binding ribbon-helix-helix protein